MTDNEIIKAKSLIEKLKDACNAYYDTSRSMPYDIDMTMRESAFCLESFIEEINRQKAEIERLKARCENTQIGYNFAKDDIEQWKEEANKYQKLWCEAVKDIQSATAEAVKEFADKLKRKSFLPLGSWISQRIIIEDDIDNLLKERVGASK